MPAYSNKCLQNIKVFSFFLNVCSVGAFDLMTYDLHFHSSMYFYPGYCRYAVYTHIKYFATSLQGATKNC